MTRAHLRPDGIPSRCDSLLLTPAELAIKAAMYAVEAIPGGSRGLTEATNLLQQASDHVADYVEGKRDE